MAFEGQALLWARWPFHSFLVFFFFALFILFLFVVVRNHVYVHRMSLRDFHLRLALRAAQNLSLFHFIFIHIQFGSTIRAADHGHFLRSEFPRLGARTTRPPPFSVLYTAQGQVKSRPLRFFQNVTRSLRFL